MASIRKRNGSYQITVSRGYDIYGKKIFETTTYTPDSSLTPKKKEKAVLEFAMKFESEIENGIALDGRKVTLFEFTERWKNEYAIQKLEPGTVERYMQELDGKVLPALGHLKLSELRPATLNSFFLSLGKDGARKDGKPGGYSKGTILKTFNVLSSVLHTAVDWEVIERNPCDKVRIKAENPADKIKFFTPEQAAIFLDYIDKPYKIKTKGHQRIDDTGKSYTVGDYESTRTMPEQFQVLFNLAIFGGLRKGELLALTWTDIDFKEDSVNINKAVSLVDGELVCKSPKTKNSIRRVSIPHFLTQRLQALKASQLRYRISVGDYWKGENWIFTQDNGRQMNYATPYHVFQETLKRYNDGKPEEDQLPLIPFHGLRHTSATLLVASHQDIKTIQSRMGHAEASTTLNIYAHALQESDRKAADALQNILSSQVI